MSDQDDAGQRYHEDVERDAARREALFKAVADAYGFVKAEELLRSTAARTIGDCLMDRVNEIKGPHPQGLPSRLEDLDRVKNTFDSAIAEMRATEELTGTENT